MDSSSVKSAVMKQILLESNMANARTLIEVSSRAASSCLCRDGMCLIASQKINENCFERCVPKPGSSISSSEQSCVTQCMEKYMAAWNQVNSAYLRRLQQEAGSSNNILS
jgi:mitochondrial import inner membrane translocase subunit TIM13